MRSLRKSLCVLLCALLLTVSLPAQVFAGALHTVTVLAGDGTMGTASASAAAAEEGAVIELQAFPNDGCHFVCWESSDADVTTGVFEMPDHDVTVTAVFEPDDAPAKNTFYIEYDDHPEEGNEAAVRVGGEVVPCFTDTPFTDGDPLEFELFPYRERQDDTPVVEIEIFCGGNNLVLRSDNGGILLNGSAFSFTPESPDGFVVRVWWSEFDAFGCGDGEFLIRTNTIGNGGIVPDPEPVGSFAHGNECKYLYRTGTDVTLTLRPDDDSVLRIAVVGFDVYTEEPGDGERSLSELFDDGAYTVTVSDAIEYEEVYIEAVFGGTSGGPAPGRFVVEYDDHPEPGNEAAVKVGGELVECYAENPFEVGEPLEFTLFPYEQRKDDTPIVEIEIFCEGEHTLLRSDDGGITLDGNAFTFTPEGSDGFVVRVRWSAFDAFSCGDGEFLIRTNTDDFGEILFDAEPVASSFHGGEKKFAFPVGEDVTAVFSPNRGRKLTFAAVGEDGYVEDPAAGEHALSELLDGDAYKYTVSGAGEFSEIYLEARFGSDGHDHEYTYTAVSAAQHRGDCLHCDDSILADHTWSGTKCTACGLEKKDGFKKVIKETVPHDSYQFDVYAVTTAGGKKFFTGSTLDALTAWLAGCGLTVDDCVFSEPRLDSAQETLDSTEPLDPAEEILSDDGKTLNICKQQKNYIRDEYRTIVCTLHYRAPDGVRLARLSGSGRQATAAKISSETYFSAESVVIASGSNYADALAGVPLAYAMRAPILLVTPDKGLDESTAAEIRRLGAKNIYILGGEAAVPAAVADSAKALGCTVTRISGSSRFDTAVKIAERLAALRGTPDEVFFVYSHNYPDALAVSSVAAVKGAPVLYVYSDGSLNAGEAHIRALKGTAKKAYVIGGYGAIKEAADANIGKYIPVTRVYGSDRYLTCAKINDTFADVLTGGAVCLATGTNFPDALAGGVLAAASASPLLLTGGTLLDYQTDYIAGRKPDTVYVFGGSAVVSDATANAALKAAEDGAGILG